MFYFSQILQSKKTSALTWPQTIPITLASLFITCELSAPDRTQQSSQGLFLFPFLQLLFPFFLCPSCQVNFAREKPWPNTSFPCATSKSLRSNRTINSANNTTAELPLVSTSPKPNKHLSEHMEAGNCRQGFYGPLSRPALAFQEPHYLAYVTFPCHLGALAGDHRLVYSRDSVWSQVGLSLLS